MGIPVHPQARQILDGKAASGAPPLWELTPGEARAGVEASNAVIAVLSAPPTFARITFWFADRRNSMLGNCSATWRRAVFCA